MELIQCALCGYEFDKRAGECHPACPLKNACQFFCCPRCGYQNVDTSRATSVKFIEWLKQKYAEQARKESV